MNAIKITNKGNHKSFELSEDGKQTKIRIYNSVLLESLITVRERCTTFALLTKRGFKMAGHRLGLDFRDMLQSLFIPVPELMYTN